MIFAESETVELKSVYVDDIKKEIIAFANSHGGSVFVGVEDDGTVCGVGDPDRLIQQIANTVRDTVKPDVTMFVHYETLRVGDKTVLEIKVQCGSHRPYCLAAKGLRPEGVFVRQGTSCVPASDAAIRQMIKETDGDSYEEMRSLVQELTFEKATAAFAKRELLFGEAQQKTLGILDADGLYTNLGLLLSDQCPHIIKAATFAGNDQSEFQDRREYGGSLLNQLDEAYAYLDMHNRTQATFEGLLRVDHRDYPDAAIREALLNAIVHRDYAVGASTLLAIYSDRIELTSVGGLAGGISYEDMMLGVSYCRNKKLADIFYRLGLIEAYGTGVQKIVNSYRDAPVKPQILVTSGAFKTVLPNQNAAKAGERMPTASPRGKREREVLRLLGEHDGLTRAEIEKALGVSTATACRLLKKMLENGLIAVTGTTYHL